MIKKSLIPKVKKRIDQRVWKKKRFIRSGSLPEQARGILYLYLLSASLALEIDHASANSQVKT